MAEIVKVNTVAVQNLVVLVLVSRGGVKYRRHHVCTCPPVYSCVYLELVHTFACYMTWLDTGPLSVHSEKCSSWYSCWATGSLSVQSERQFNRVLHGSGAMIPGRYRTMSSNTQSNKATAVERAQQDKHGRSWRRTTINAQVQTIPPYFTGDYATF